MMRTEAMNRMKMRCMFAVFVVLPLAFAQAQDAQTVSGRLTEREKPIGRALVVLQRMQDEKCARIFMKPFPSPREQRRLEKCAKDLPSIYAEDNGDYAYQRLKPGWYDIRFLWLTGEPHPADRQVTCQTGEWMIVLSPVLDNSGRYNAFANGKPFELKKGESRKIDFDYHGQGRDGGQCGEQKTSPAAQTPKTSATPVPEFTLSTAKGVVLLVAAMPLCVSGGEWFLFPVYNLHRRNSCRNRAGSF